MYKHIVQLTLILIICALFYIFFKFFLNQSITEKIIENDKGSTIEKKQINKIESDEKNKKEIEKLSYFSEDFEGNQYKIIANSASSITQKNNNTLLAGVSAEINFINKDKLIINSNFAEYNQLNNNTMFKGNVNIVYSIYKINSEVVNLDFERNLIEIYENIVFKSINNRLYADKVILNMINKNLKILMKDKKDNILITGNIPE